MDWALEQLASEAEQGELELAPTYQRGLVWDRKMASRLVVTALENRIVPAVYFEEAEDGRLRVMDGKQRLTSLITFLRGTSSIGGVHWPNAPVELDVKEDDSCDARWHGKTFKSLPPDRARAFRKFSLTCLKVSKETRRDVIFAIYQDINTGSVSHTAQQSRKAAFHGPYVVMLDRLALNRDFLNIQGRTEPDAQKEYDRELILRFFAMLRSRSAFKPPLVRFLNKELMDFQHAEPAELQQLESVFASTAATVWQIWGSEACRMPGKQQLNPALWDAAMVAVAEELACGSRRRKELISAAAGIRAAYAQLCSDRDFLASLATKSRRLVTGRVDAMRRLLAAAAPPASLDTRRGFSGDVKETLWKRGGQRPLCALCSQVIHMVSDAEVDHVLPWSRGGRTSLDNAQLVHRFCNRNKGNRLTAQAEAA